MASGGPDRRIRPALPDRGAVEAAAERIRPHVSRTPLLESPLLDRHLGGRLLIKAEVLQHTGSFKFRGACNRIGRLSGDERAAGVVAFSSGNHAQGVARAARIHGAPATVVMPADAPAVKLRGARAYGADVVAYDREREDRREIARALAERAGRAMVEPFDDPDVIAGQGTVGLEIAEQTAGLGCRPDAVVAPVGGGGLIAGIGLGLDAREKGVPLVGVEPAAYDDTRRSLESGRREANPPGRRSICDALAVPTPGELTFALNRRRLETCLAVGDDDVRTAMAVAFAHFRLVVEPGGAVALAAVLSGRISCRDRVIVVVASGGNVDRGTFVDALDGADWTAPPLAVG